MPETYAPEIVTLQPRPVALYREKVAMSALTDYFARAFTTVAATVAMQGAAITGPPVGVYYGIPTEMVDVGAGFPTDRPVSPADGVTPETLPGGRIAQVLHAGSYDQMEVTYGRLTAWLAAQGLTPGEVMWETYLTDYDPAAPEATRTLIEWPLA